MSIVRKSIRNVRKAKGKVDRAKVAALSDEDRERMKREDGVSDSDFGEPRTVLPQTDVRALRKRLKLSQEAFAKRFFLPLRTVQDWEQYRREPSETACVLLFAIANDPEAVEGAIRAGRGGEDSVKLESGTRISALRKEYGSEFLAGFRGDATLGAVLKKTGTGSLMRLLGDRVGRRGGKRPP